MNGQTYTWDNNGNLLSDGLLSYSYDQANRLKQVTQGANTYTFAYNGVGDRLSQTVGITTTRYVLDPAAGLTQVLADGTNSYLYGNGRLAQYQTAMQYFGADGLGSVRQLYDASGQVIATNRYDPYGNLMSHYGDATSVFGYTGEQYDAATGLEYLRARYYSSAQGRFTTRDTWEGDPNAPMSYDAWNYGYGDPVNLMDPNGQDPDWPLWFGLLNTEWAFYDRATELQLNGRPGPKGTTEYVPFVPHTSGHVDPRLVYEQNQYNNKILANVREYFPEEDYLQVAKWIKRQIGHESRFDKDHVGENNDEGLMQVRRKKAGLEVARKWYGKDATELVGNLFDVDFNLKVGFEYLRISHDKIAAQDYANGWTLTAEESWKLTFAGYNASPYTIVDFRESVRTGTPTPIPTPTKRPAVPPTPTPRLTPRPTATATVCPASLKVLWEHIALLPSMPEATKNYVASIFDDWRTTP